MNAFRYRTVLMLLTSFALPSFATATVEASHPQALLLAPGSDYGLPRFGFSSFSIGGVGERVTYVRWGGLASQLGLEPGDIILSMNGYRLTYHGSWNDALYEAVANGGWVQLRIRDVHTGHVAFRQTFVGGGGVGPITPHYYGGHPSGPATYKSQVGGNHNYNMNKKIKEIAELFD